MLSGLFELSPEPCWSGIYLVWLSTKRKKIKKKEKRKSIWKASLPLERRKVENARKRGTGDDTEDDEVGDKPSPRPSQIFHSDGVRIGLTLLTNPNTTHAVFPKNIQNNNNNHVDLGFLFSPCTLPVITPMIPSVSFPASRLRWSLVTDSSVSRRAN